MITVKSSLTKLSLLGWFALASFVPVSLAASVDFDERPLPVKTPPPVYPASMARAGVQGTVAVKVVIDENGAVAACTVSKSSHPEFEEPAVEAVKTWKFKPAVKDGAKVKAEVIIPIRFNQED
jgi:protein TonB